MKWSWKLFRFKGIDVNIHATFALLLIWVAYSYWATSQSITTTLYGVAFIIALFTCVLLHEFGHALTAQKYGITTKNITLLPIGGISNLEKMPEKPREELRVALAGPAVNLGLAAIFAVGMFFTSGFQSFNWSTLISGTIWQKLFAINISLGLFNLITAFPMDGGRVLRAALAARMEFSRATQIAANIGQLSALIFGFVGLIYDPLLIFIALFIWIGASQESSAAQVKSALSGIYVSQAMITKFDTLTPQNRLGDAVDLILSGTQQDFPVVQLDQVVGMLTRSDLIKTLSEEGKYVNVQSVMQKSFTTVNQTDEIEIAAERLQKCGCKTLPVTDDTGHLVGIITMENIAEFLMIQSALKRSQNESF